MSSCFQVYITPYPWKNGNCGGKWSISSKMPPSTFEFARIFKLEKCTSFTIVKVKLFSNLVSRYASNCFGPFLKKSHTWGEGFRGRLSLGKTVYLTSIGRSIRGLYGEVHGGGH